MDFNWILIINSDCEKVGDVSHMVEMRAMMIEFPDLEFFTKARMSAHIAMHARVQVESIRSYID